VDAEALGVHGLVGEVDLEPDVGDLELLLLQVHVDVPRRVQVRGQGPLTVRANRANRS